MLTAIKAYWPLNADLGANSAYAPYNDLNDGLVSLWPLTSDGTDSVGSNDLTNNNGVTFVAKGAGAPVNMPATVANFVAASSQYFSLASTSFPSMVGGATVAAWVNFPSQAGTPEYLSWVGPGDNWNMYINGGGVYFQSYILDSVSGFSQADSTAYSVDTWHLVILWYDPADMKTHFQFDANAPVAGSALANGPLNTAANFNIGARNGASFITGRISQPMFWSRVLTAYQRAALWNESRGTFYPF